MLYNSYEQFKNMPKNQHHLESRVAGLIPQMVIHLNAIHLGVGRLGGE